MADAVNGMFTVQGTTHPVPGTFSWLEDGTYDAWLSELLYDLQQVTVDHLADGSRRTAVSGDPRKIVCDFRPRIVGVTLHTGQTLTLLDPQAVFDPFARAEVEHNKATVEGLYNRFSHVRLAGKTALVGMSCLSSPRVSGVRWSIGAPVNSAGWMENTATAVPAQGLKPWLNTDRAGVELTFDEHLSVSDAVGGRLGSTMQVIRLCTLREIKPQRIELCIDGQWVEYRGPQVDDQGVVGRGDLLQLSDISLKTLQKWHEIAPKLGSIPYIPTPWVQTPAIEVDAQIRSTAAEGLHRGLYPEEKRFKLDKNQCNKVISAAAGGAAAALHEEQGSDLAASVKEAVRESLGHFDQLTYKNRLLCLLTEVESLLPGLFGPDRKTWIDKVAYVRNTQSHQTNSHDKPDGHFSTCFMVSETLGWLLLVRILKGIVEETTLQNALRHSARLQYTLANLDQEYPWSRLGFSSYDTFMGHQER